MTDTRTYHGDNRFTFDADGIRYYLCNDAMEFGHVAVTARAIGADFLFGKSEKRLLPANGR